MNDNAPSTFDPKALQQRVKDTVISQFGMMIPELAWNDMVQKEITAFFETEVSFEWSRFRDSASSGWGSNSDTQTLKTQMTPFRQIVWTELNKLNQERMREYFEGDKFKLNVNYDPSQQIALNAYFEEQLEKSIPKIAAVFLNNAFAQIAHQVKGEIVNGLVVNR